MGRNAVGGGALVSHCGRTDVWWVDVWCLGGVAKGWGLGFEKIRVRMYGAGCEVAVAVAKGQVRGWKAQRLDWTGLDRTGQDRRKRAAVLSRRCDNGQRRGADDATSSGNETGQRGPAGGSRPVLNLTHGAQPKHPSIQASCVRCLAHTRRAVVLWRRGIRPFPGAFGPASVMAPARSILLGIASAAAHEATVRERGA